jgi:hypothetical protein
MDPLKAKARFVSIKKKKAKARGPMIVYGVPKKH